MFTPKARRIQLLDKKGYPTWADFEINELGYRGKSFTESKGQDATRIIFYGGSQVFNFGASSPNDWPSQVGVILRATGHSGVETINAGIPGHALFDSFGRLFAEGHRFSPDFVVLDNTWNDLKLFTNTQSLLRAIKPAQPWRDPRLYYHFPGDRFLSENFEIYRRIRNKAANFYVGGGLESARIQEYASSEEKKSPRKAQMFLSMIMLWINTP